MSKPPRYLVRTSTYSHTGEYISEVYKIDLALAIATGYAEQHNIGAEVWDRWQRRVVRWISDRAHAQFTLEWREELEYQRQQRFYRKLETL